MEISDAVRSPSIVFKHIFYIHTKNGHLAKEKNISEPIFYSETNFIQTYNMSAVDYIKRKQ